MATKLVCALIFFEICYTAIIPIEAGPSRGLSTCKKYRVTPQCTELTPKCSDAFVRTCGKLYGMQRRAYFPNCLGHHTESEANKDFKDFLRRLYKFKFKKDNQTKECFDLLLPFACTAYYPLCISDIMYTDINHTTAFTDTAVRRLAPCYSYCLHTQDVCIKAAIDISSFWLDTCNKLYAQNICSREWESPKCISPSPIVSSSSGTLPLPAPTNSTSCYEKCTNKTLLESKHKNKHKHKKNSCKKNGVKEKISKKDFSHYGFAAHVNITEEVYLCKPIEAIAYKAVVIEDYFLSCSSCVGNDTQKSVGEIVHIFTDDSVTDLNKQCLRKKISTFKEYLVLGNLIEEHQSECGHKLWILKASNKKKCVLYPWDDVVKHGKNSKIRNWVTTDFKCTVPCVRS